MYVIFGVDVFGNEFEANIVAVRTVYCAIDPIYAGKHFLAREAHMMATISFPLELISTLLLALYWYALLL